MTQVIKIFPVIALFVLFSSCSSDDSTEMSTFSETDILGQWILIELNSTPAIDIENNGNLEENIMLQTSCFDGWGLNFEANANFTANSSDIDFNPTASPSLVCTPRTDSGTFSLAGNDLTVSVLVDGNVETQTISITIDNNTLSFTATESEVAAFFNIPDDEIYSDLLSIEFVLQKIN
jgi:hypothetical protein